MSNVLYRSRHSVWSEVRAVVLLGALFLGGAGYLLLHADTAATGLAVEAAQERRARASAPKSRLGRSGPRLGRRSMQNGTSRPLLGNRSATGPSGTAAPFSKSWRREATPSLSGPSDASGGSRGGTVGGSAESRSDGPAIASSRSYGSGRSSYESAPRSADWRAEAQRLGSRARALSGVLGQMDRESASQGGAAPAQSSTADAGTGGQATTADRTVPDPPDPVPIDDHLHWLVVAGLLWGAWRIGRGA